MHGDCERISEYVGTVLDVEGTLTGFRDETIRLEPLQGAALGADVLTSISAVAACMFNIGPGLGDVEPAEHYGHFPALSKWVLSVCMLAGLLEFSIRSWWFYRLTFGGSELRISNM